MPYTSEELQTRLSAIVETSDDAIISKNLQGIIQSWNGAAERIFGYTAREMMGQPITKIIPPDRQDEEPAILQKLMRGERVDHFQTVRMRKDGTRVELSVTISPIKDATGKVVGASKIARDISEHRSLQRERDQLLAAERAARGEAERANRTKDEFIATLSHELRTPLNAILGWTQLIGQPNTDAATMQEGIVVIERNAKAQAQLIEDLLDMGRIMSGKIRLDLKPVDMAGLIASTVESVKPLATAKGLTMALRVEADDATVAGDAARLQQVVWNLLNNAIKFTEPGGAIEVGLQRLNGVVEFTVRDTGRGIKAEFLPHVFERFRQADATTTRQHAGLGIGLAIVKQIVELHRGQVRVHSAGEGRGAAFTVMLPQAADVLGRGRPAANGTALGSLSLRDVTVLVVEDESDTREYLGRLLRSFEATVMSAESAEGALEAFRARVPDVVVSDIGMPRRDGYDFIRAVRRMPAEKGGRVPAVALTAFARLEDRTRAMLAGYQVHMAKPVDAQELVATVASLIGRTGQAN